MAVLLLATTTWCGSASPNAAPAPSPPPPPAFTQPAAAERDAGLAGAATPDAATMTMSLSPPRLTRAEKDHSPFGFFADPVIDESPPCKAKLLAAELRVDAVRANNANGVALRVSIKNCGAMTRVLRPEIAFEAFDDAGNRVELEDRRWAQLSAPAPTCEAVATFQPGEERLLMIGGAIFVGDHHGWSVTAGALTAGVASPARLAFFLVPPQDAQCLDDKTKTRKAIGDTHWTGSTFHSRLVELR